MLQLVRACVANNNGKRVGEVSQQQLLEDVCDEPAAVCRLPGGAGLAAAGDALRA